MQTKRVRINDLKSLMKEDIFKLARKKQSNLIAELIYSINVNAQEPETDNTMLHYAVLLGDKKLIMLLLSTTKANLLIKNMSGHSPLEIARDCGNKDIIGLFEEYIRTNVSKNASMPNLSNKDEESPRECRLTFSKS